MIEQEDILYGRISISGPAVKELCPLPSQEKDITITQNGSTTLNPDLGYTLSKVNITTNVPSEEPVLETIDITQNGTYTPEEGVDGFDEVNVNVPQIEPVLESLSVTANGTYTPETGVDGYDEVTVNVPQIEPVLQTLNVTQNGTYTPATGIDGFDEVVVNTPNYLDMLYPTAKIIRNNKAYPYGISTEEITIVKYGYNYVTGNTGYYWFSNATANDIGDNILNHLNNLYLSGQVSTLRGWPFLQKTLTSEVPTSIDHGNSSGFQDQTFGIWVFKYNRAIYGKSSPTPEEAMNFIVTVIDWDGKILDVGRFKDIAPKIVAKEYDLTKGICVVGNELTWSASSATDYVYLNYLSN